MINTVHAKFSELKQSTRFAELIGSTTYQMLLISAITAAAVAMRFFKLGRWSFWIDEIYEIGYAQDAILNFSITRRLSLLLTGWVLNFLGTNEWTARLVPALVGILSIPVLFFLVRKMFGSGVALLAAFLLAVSPWHLHWSQNARFYTLLMFFYTLAFFIFYDAMEKDRPGSLILSLFLLGLASQERKMALFFVPVVLVYFLSVTFLPFGRPAGLNRRNLLIMGGMAVLFGLFETLSVVFGGNPTYSAFVEVLIGHQHNPVRLLLSSVSEIGLPVFLLALFSGFYLIQRKSRAGLFLFLGAVIPLALLVLASPFVQAFSRYIFLTLPLWLVLAALAVKELFVQTQKNARLLVLGVLLLLVAEPLSQDMLYYSYQNGNRQDWKGAFAIVRQGQAAGDAVVTTRPQIGEYYMQGPVTWTQGLDPKQVVASGQRTWFVVDDRTGFISPALQSFLLEKTRLVGVRDVYMPGLLMAMRVYLYEPPG